MGRYPYNKVIRLSAGLLALMEKEGESSGGLERNEKEEGTLKEKVEVPSEELQLLKKSDLT